VALDVYVMPLSRFWAGEFRPVSEDASRDESLGGRAPSCPPQEARERVTAVQEHLSRSTGTDARWNDDGESAFATRFERLDLHALRAFAAHHEKPGRLAFLRRRFAVRRDPREHPQLRKIYEGADTTFAHLMRHSDDRGFFAPTNFSEPVLCNERNWWMVGSSPRLLGELERISGLFDDATPSAVRRAWEVLRDAAQASVEHQLPIIWQGK
jgi:hypothetical protein